MLLLEQITKNAVIAGMEPGVAVTIRFVETHGPDAIEVNYRLPTGETRERMLFRTDEATLKLAETGRPWSFDADADSFKLAAEAYRINLAHLFDPMMAVHTSNVDPLPHQITAVYEAMLPRQPLRYVLADDPGAGKTVMAGLLIRELLMRADAKRVLIVTPGSLVEQWQDEMDQKFGLDFKVFGRDMIENSRSANPFDDFDLLVARIDQLSRNDDLKVKLQQTQWDLIVVDEAHKLSANYNGNKVEKTRRFLLGELLGRITRHFLLMTATPHNGKNEDFQLWLSLLDADRFYGKTRDGSHKVEVSDLMRRMVKEDLLKFDGTKLFPERRAYTVNYALSDPEAALYEAVTTYVKTEMGRAEHLGDDKRKVTIGFALTSLQRRLASSPAAIALSLERRHNKLQRRLEEAKLLHRGQPLNGVSGNSAPAQQAPDDLDDLDAAEIEQLEEDLVDHASAAKNIVELEAEIYSLAALVEQARRVCSAGIDRKWSELSGLLQNTPEMFDTTGARRKLIIFTEHRDTLNYLNARLCGLMGNTGTVITIHGGTPREERRKAQEMFRNDPTVQVLLATDAAGEGVNLQNANLMVNYDLPWNPNRIEQRFGRIHRIGQTQVCHLWNLVARETREGYVFARLFEKLEVERVALGGRVFDILGEVFEERSLRELLIEAICYGEDPATKARLHTRIEGALDTEHLRDIIARNALYEVGMDPEHLFAVKAEMERAEARKLQPFFIRAFFQQAFQQLDGELRPREAGRFEIIHVPAIIRERDRQITGRDRRHVLPVLKRYERICFEKEAVRLTDQVGAPMASLVHPGHPLMQSVTDIVLEKHRNALKRGTVLVDHADSGVEPRVLFILDHSVLEGADTSRTASRRMQFVEIDAQGHAVHAGWAPHLDLQPITSADLQRVQDVLNAAWITQDLERVAMAYAASQLVPEHYKDVSTRREQQANKILRAVHERLIKEINYWSDRYIKLREDLAAGKDVRLPLENIRRTIDDLTARRQQRERELNDSKHLISSPPIVVGGALVIPAGLLTQRGSDAVPPVWSADAEARAAIERRAMQAVIAAEERAGRHVTDVSALKCGWDVTSEAKSPADPDPVRHIEVKGRIKGASTITVTRNEVMYGLNQAAKFMLAIVLIDGDQHDGPHYVRAPFQQEPDWATTSVNFDLAKLIEKAQQQAIH